MTNNDIIRRVRYIFDFSDDKMMKIFNLAEAPATREQISSWLKKEEDEGFASLHDKQLALFLNGLIIMRRGKKEGATPKPEKRLNNNGVLRKLKIALDLKAEDIIELLDQVGFKFSKSELSAFFRKPDHKHYKECKDQVLRNLLLGIQGKFRGLPDSEDVNPVDESTAKIIEEKSDQLIDTPVEILVDDSSQKTEEAIEVVVEKARPKKVSNSGFVRKGKS
ncbi:MAG: DUF1456 family protein [Fibrobacterales bacterium]